MTDNTKRPTVTISMKDAAELSDVQDLCDIAKQIGMPDCASLELSFSVLNLTWYLDSLDDTTESA